MWSHKYTYCLSTGPEEDEALRGRKGFRGQTVVNQNPETELMLEGDDDAVSLLQEKEVDNLAGESIYTQCNLYRDGFPFSMHKLSHDMTLSFSLKVLCATWVWMNHFRHNLLY